MKFLFIFESSESDTMPGLESDTMPVFEGVAGMTFWIGSFVAVRLLALVPLRLLV